MSQLTDEQLQNTNSVIANGLEAKTMRHKIENKDLLSQKGALYVGTGNTTSTGAAVTTSIAPNGGTDDGKILIADSAKIEGWKIDKIGNDNITNGAITGDKLTNGTITGDKLAENFTYITSDTSSFCLQDSSNNSTPRLSFVESNNHASVALQADLKSQELEGESYTLTLPNENGTVAIKEQIENGDIIVKTAEQLKGWYRHFVTVNLVKGSGPSAASFDVFFELFTRSAGQITNMSKLIAAIQTFGYTALATGAGYVGTGANISDAYHINTNILENRVYNVLRVVYDDHLSTKACCMMIAKTTVSNISSEGYDFNIVAMDKFNDVYVGDAVSFLFS